MPGLTNRLEISREFQFEGSCSEPLSNKQVDNPRNLADSLLLCLCLVQEPEKGSFLTKEKRMKEKKKTVHKKLTATLTTFMFRKVAL